jgi:hypothetical protein
MQTDTNRRSDCGLEASCKLKAAATRDCDSPPRRNVRNPSATRPQSWFLRSESRDAPVFAPPNELETRGDWAVFAAFCLDFESSRSGLPRLFGHLAAGGASR